MAGSSNQELEVFSAARQLPPGERAGFLDSSCAGDPDLRRRVEELLQTGRQAASFLERPASELLNPGEFVRHAAAPAEKIGDRIGRYELIEQIGTGGCGVVYKARQEEPVRRYVALKIIKLGMDTRSVIARFEAERQALALMDHPNIAKVLDAGATDTGRPYFVMELVEGVKITDFCDHNHLSIRERLELFIQVCHAVQHAHQKGIIHRDLKPSNILAAMSDGVPLPRVIDFGIAKATRGKLTDETLFTAREQFIGTPAYMSPEQADAREMDIDTRSDIYSLGALLYELLTGRTPFDAKELLDSGLDKIRHTIAEREPAAPSTRLNMMTRADLLTIAQTRKAEPPQLSHLVRGDLDCIIMKALEKDRARRYQTTHDLALDIRRHLNNEPVAAGPPSGLYQFQKLVQRNKLVVTAAAAVVLALAVGAAISVRFSFIEHQALMEADQQRLQAQANEQKAEIEEQKARTEAARSSQIAQFLESMLQGVGPSVAMGADTTLLKKILDNTSKRIGSDLTNEPGVEADLRNTLGEVYWEIGGLTNAETMYRRALAINIETSGPQAPEAAESMEHLSHVLWREGKLDEADTLAKAGIAIQSQLYGETNLQVARSLEDYAAILNTKGFGARAASTLRQSLAVKETVLGHDNLEVADTLDDLSGMLWSMHSNLSQAQAMRREALAIREKILGATNILVLINSLQVQKIQEDIEGRSSDEEATLNQLVSAQRRLYGGPHPNIAQSLNTLASVLKNEGKLAESEDMRRQALAIQELLLGSQSAEVAQTLGNLGAVLAAEGKFADAEPLLRECYQVRAKLFGGNSALTATAMVDLGQTLEDEGKIDDATNLYLTVSANPGASAASADYCLSLLYLHGKGVRADPVEAARWMSKSAQLGHTEAQISMGVFYFNGIGVPQDEESALAWFHQATITGSSVTMKLATMKTLANCYCAAGRSREAIATLQEISDSYPNDADAWLTLAAWQAWFNEKSGFEATRTRIIQAANETDDAGAMEAAAKAWCLEPATNEILLAKAMELAELAVECRKKTPSLPWYQLSLGMVQYRNHQYEDAARNLALAEYGGSQLPDVPPVARFYHALCLYAQNRIPEARQLFEQTRAQMVPYPQDPNKPVVDGTTASHDVIITWLAYREAKSVLYGTE